MRGRNSLDIPSCSKPDVLLKGIQQTIKRKDHFEEIQTILQCHLDNIPDASNAEMQAQVWLQWARQKKHLKVNTINYHLVFCQVIRSSVFSVSLLSLWHLS